MNDIQRNNRRALTDRDSKGKKWEDYDTIKCLDGTILDMQKLVKDQATAKAALIHLEPMFATFANQLEIVYTFRTETQATDGYHLFVNPQFTAGLSFEEKVFVMAHECMHCLLDHMRRGRAAGHDPHKSNVAADYECNDTLVDLGLFSASTIKHIHALYDPKYTGMSYENIYDSNPPDPSGGKDGNNKEGQKGQGGQGGQSGQSGQKGQSGQSGQGGNGGQNEEGTDQGSHNGQGGNGGQGGQDGSGGQGVVTPEDCGGDYFDGCPSTPGGFVDANTGNQVAKAEGYDGANITDDAIMNKWKEIAIKEATDNRKNKHGGHANFCSKILGLWKTNTDWKKAFKKVIGKSLNLQDRRSAFANKNALASQDRISRTDKDKYDALDYITIFIDSSGSITDDMLKYMLSEVYSIALNLKPETLVVIQEDTRVEECQIFHSLAEFNKYAKLATVKGRGGNNQEECWRFLREDKRFKGKRSELVIMFTDGYLDQHKRDPKTMNNLCWAILDNPGFELEYNDPRTSVIHLDTSKIKK